MEFDRTLSGSTPASEAALSAMLQNDFDDFGTSPADAGFGMLGSSFDGAEPFLGIDPSDTDPNSFMCNPFVGAPTKELSSNSLADAITQAETVGPDALPYGDNMFVAVDAVSPSMAAAAPATSHAMGAPTLSAYPSYPAPTAYPTSVPSGSPSNRRAPRAAAAGVRAATAAVSGVGREDVSAQRVRIRARGRRPARSDVTGGGAPQGSPTAAAAAAAAAAVDKRAPAKKRRSSQAAGRPSRCPNPDHAEGCTNGPHCKCPSFPPYCTHGPGGCVSTQNVKWRKFCNSCLAGKRNSKKKGLIPAKAPPPRHTSPAGQVAHVNKKRALPSAGRPSMCPNPDHITACTNGPHCKCPGFTKCKHGPGGCVSTQNVKWRKFCNSCLAAKRVDKRAAARAAALAAGREYVSPLDDSSDGVPTPMNTPLTQVTSPAAYATVPEVSYRGMYSGNPFSNPDAGRGGGVGAGAGGGGGAGGAGGRFTAGGSAGRGGLPPRPYAGKVEPRAEAPAAPSGGADDGGGAPSAAPPPWYSPVDSEASAAPSELSIEQLEEIALTGFGSPVDGLEIDTDLRPLASIIDDSGVGAHRTAVPVDFDFVWSGNDRTGAQRHDEEGERTEDADATGAGAGGAESQGTGAGAGTERAGEAGSSDGRAARAPGCADSGAGTADDRASRASVSKRAAPVTSSGRTHSVDPSLPPILAEVGTQAHRPAVPSKLRVSSFPEEDGSGVGAGGDGSSKGPAPTAPPRRPPSVTTPVGSADGAPRAHRQPSVVTASVDARRLSRSDKARADLPDLEAGGESPLPPASPASPGDAAAGPPRAQPAQNEQGHSAEVPVGRRVSGASGHESIISMPSKPELPPPPRSLCVAYLMWPLGFLGIHHFYLRRTAMGFIYLFTFGLLGMGWLSDLVRMPSLVMYANKTRKQRKLNEECQAVIEADARVIAMGGGFLGLHHFYLRRFGWAILYLFTFGLLGLGWLTDICRISTIVKQARKDQAGKGEFTIGDTRLLAVFLGWMGAHHFYLKSYGWGVLYALTFGLGGFGWWVDVARANTLVGAAFVDKGTGPRPRTGHSAAHMLAHTVTNTQLLTVTTGALGGHHFYLHRWGWGILYACTGGLFGVGWVYDMFRARQMVLTTRDLQMPGCKPYTVGDSRILCFTLGFVGAHHFYHKRWGWGVLYACTFGMLGFGWVMDAINMPAIVERVNVQDVDDTGAAFHYTAMETGRLMPLGFLGTHHFYLGRPLWGLLYMCTFGVLGVGWIVDCCRIKSLVAQVNEDRTQRFAHNQFHVAEAYILAGPLGFLGLHHFYLRRYGLGVAYLFTFGILGFGWISDLLRLPTIVEAETKRQDTMQRNRVGSMNNSLVRNSNNVTAQRSEQSGSEPSDARTGYGSDEGGYASPKRSTTRGGARVCCVCADEPVDTALLPCGHSVLCMSCAGAMHTRSAPCPICRKPVGEVKQLIFA